jgi:hypothetical protein
MNELGVKDPEQEFARWLEERETILTMNRKLNARPSRGAAGERNGEPRAETGD